MQEGVDGKRRRRMYGRRIWNYWSILKDRIRKKYSKLGEIR